MSRKLYSLILLVSILTGILQPALPMIEYHLQGKDLTELFLNNEGLAGRICEGSGTPETEADCALEEPDTSLINEDFYPVPVRISGIATALLLPEISKSYHVLIESVAVRFSLPISPPPRS